MKLTAPNLSDFLALLPAYGRLPVVARRDLASIERPSQSCSADELRNSLAALVGSGFLLPPTERRRCCVAPDRIDFVRVLRLLGGHSVFQTPKQPIFAEYMENHFTSVERDRLRPDSAKYSHRNWDLYRQITSPDWVERFLRAKNAEDWERPYMEPGTSALLGSGVLRAAQTLVRWLLDRGGRAAMRDLFLLPFDPALLSTALHASLRYLLLFAALDGITMEPVVGVWPATAAHISLIAAPQPASVIPTETFDAGFLLDDMTTLLIACANEPLRLKANDGGLFAKSVRELSLTLRALPKWVEEAFYMDPETRLLTAAEYLRTFGLVEERGHLASRLEAAARGLHWLRLSTDDRQRVIVDGVMDRKQSVPGFHDFEGARIGAVAPRVGVSTSMKTPPDIGAEVIRLFGLFQRGSFFPIESIVTFARAANPLQAIFSKDRYAYLSIGSGFLDRPDAEQLQEVWSELVRGFLRVRLLPLGAVRLGTGKEGLSIAITPVGRYFLGTTKEWERAPVIASQVIVQPNFEVTFLGEAPGAEAEIGRFAERRGRNMGALFQITKASIFVAAGAGMTVRDVFEILARICTREVPANVGREIEGWFAQCRKVSFESVMVIRCPDRDTAMRIVGLAKGSAVALSDTVLEYKDPGKQRAWLLKKLKSMGVLVSVHEPKREKPKPIPRVTRRW